MACAGKGRSKEAICDKCLNENQEEKVIKTTDLCDEAVCSNIHERKLQDMSHGITELENILKALTSLCKDSNINTSSTLPESTYETIPKRPRNLNLQGDADVSNIVTCRGNVCRNAYMGYTMMSPLKTCDSASCVNRPKEPKICGSAVCPKRKIPLPKVTFPDLSNTKSPTTPICKEHTCPLNKTKTQSLKTNEYPCFQNEVNNLMTPPSPPAPMIKPSPCSWNASPIQDKSPPAHSGLSGRAVCSCNVTTSPSPPAPELKPSSWETCPFQNKTSAAPTGLSGQTPRFYSITAPSSAPSSGLKPSSWETCPFENKSFAAPASELKHSSWKTCPFQNKSSAEPTSGLKPCSWETCPFHNKSSAAPSSWETCPFQNKSSAAPASGLKHSSWETCPFQNKSSAAPASGLKSCSWETCPFQNKSSAAPSSWETCPFQNKSSAAPASGLKPSSWETCPFQNKSSVAPTGLSGQTPRFYSITAPSSAPASGLKPSSWETCPFQNKSSATPTVKSGRTPCPCNIATPPSPPAPRLEPSSWDTCPFQNKSFAAPTELSGRTPCPCNISTPPLPPASRLKPSSWETCPFQNKSFAAPTGLSGQTPRFYSLTTPSSPPASGLKPCSWETCPFQDKSSPDVFHSIPYASVEDSKTFRTIDPDFDLSRPHPDQYRMAQESGQEQQGHGRSAVGEKQPCCNNPNCPNKPKPQAVQYENPLTTSPGAISPCPYASKRYPCGSPSCPFVNPSGLIHTHEYANDRSFVQEASRPYSGSASPFDYLLSVQPTYPTPFAANYALFSYTDPPEPPAPCPYSSKKKKTCGRPTCRYVEPRPEKDNFCIDQTCPYGEEGPKRFTCDRPNVLPCGNPNCKYAKKEKSEEKKPNAIEKTCDDPNVELCDNPDCQYSKKRKEEQPEGEEQKPRKDSKATSKSLGSQLSYTEGYDANLSQYSDLNDDKGPCISKTCPFLKKLVFCEDCGGLLPGSQADSKPQSSQQQYDAVSRSASENQNEGSAESESAENITAETPKSPKEELSPDYHERIGPQEVYSLYSYPGVQIGHRDCSLTRKMIPKNMGWLWTCIPGVGNPKYWRGYKPGAICRTVYKMIRKHRKQLGLIDPNEAKKKKSRSRMKLQDLKHCIEVKKTEGDYTITVNPVKDPKTRDPLDNPYMDVTPMQFKVEKMPKVKETTCFCPCDEDSEPEVEKSESDFEFHFTPPAAIPETRVKKVKNMAEIQIQYDINDLDPDTKKMLKKAKGGGGGKSTKGGGKSTKGGGKGKKVKI